MPKQDATLETLHTVLNIFYNNRPNYLPNIDFKDEFKISAGLNEDADGAMVVKKPEMARYFGLVDNDNYQGNHQRITERGIRYFEAMSENEKIEIIFESLENDSFGRNNCAIKSSDSLIDPPKLFLKAIYELERININEFSYLLYSMHDEEHPFIYSLEKIIDYRNGTFSFPNGIPTKYRDSKFTAFFESIGILEKEGTYYKIPNNIYIIYGNRISQMSVYNEENNFTQLVENEDNNENLNTRIINQELLNNLNNRLPELEERTQRIRYKTNNRIKKTVFINSEYMCSVDINHSTFIAKDNNPFVEGHHLIPMAVQGLFPDINLDRIENIITLCPNCHRQIHYGNEEERFGLLEYFYNQKIEIFRGIRIDISFDELKSYYQ